MAIQDLFVADPPVVMMFRPTELYAAREGFEWIGTTAGRYIVAYHYDQ